jgi:hypothetical protein
METFYENNQMPLDKTDLPEVISGNLRKSSYIISVKLWHVSFFGFLNAMFTFLCGGLFVIVMGLALIQLLWIYLAYLSHAMMSKNDLRVERNEAWKFFGIIVKIFIRIIRCSKNANNIWMLGKNNFDSFEGLSVVSDTGKSSLLQFRIAAQTETVLH